MVLLRYCCGTVSVLLRYHYGTVGVRFGLVRFGSVRDCHSLMHHVRGLVDVEVSVVRNEQTLIPTLASFSAIAVGLYPPLNQ